MKQKFYLSLFILQLVIVFASCNMNPTKIDLSDTRGFKCQGATGQEIPIRLTDTGDVECFSVDGKECSTGFKTDWECRSYIVSKMLQMKPVVCQAAQYEQADHWCSEGKKFFYTNWHCPEETGLNVAIKFDESFVVECLSLDGKTCLTDKAASAACKKAGGSCGDFMFKSMMPVKCTKSDNTETNNNWCQKGFGYFRYDGIWECTDETSVATALRIAETGQVECLSNDGKGCVWGLDSVAKCDEAIQKYTDGGKKPGLALECGAEQQKLYGNPGYNDPNHWCSKGYNVLYSKATAKPEPTQTKKTPTQSRSHPSYHSSCSGFFCWFHNVINTAKNDISNDAEKVKNFVNTVKDNVTKGAEEGVKEVEKIVKSGANKTEQGFKDLVNKVKDLLPVPKGITLPTWAENLKNTLLEPVTKTAKGLENLKNELLKHGFVDPTGKIFDSIKSNLEKGGQDAIESISHAISNAIPELKKIVDDAKDKLINGVKDIIDPDWLVQLKKDITSAAAKTDAGIKNIIDTLKDKGYQFSKNTWSDIENDIKSGEAAHTPAVLNKILDDIRNGTPSIKAAIEAAAQDVKSTVPSWFTGLSNFLGTEEAKTEAGINQIKKTLEDNKSFMPDSIWNDIKSTLQSGKAAIDSDIKNDVIDKIKKYLPSFKPSIDSLFHIHINVASCGDSFFNNLKSLVSKVDVKTKDGLNQIKSFLDTNAKIAASDWDKIESGFKTGSLTAEDFIKNIMSKIPHEEWVPVEEDRLIAVDKTTSSDKLVAVNKRTKKLRKRKSFF